MPKRLSSQKRLHRRDVECSEGFQVADRILFPKAYEDAWKHDEDGDKHRSDFRRARLLIRRIAMVNAGPTIVGELEAIVTNRKTCTIPALATAIQSRIFKDRHTSFATNPLVQCVRFMLIKGRIHQNKQSERTKSVLDFFFDPTLERNLNPLPLEDLIVYQYPARPLKVAIIGGGPTALATAISLAEKGEGKIEVHVYDERWTSIQCPDGSSYVDYPPDAHRRDQVVTLQDHVTSLLSEESYDALFEGGPERVWPGSANIQIRKVEDHFLNRVQDPGFRDFIHLHTIGVTRTDLGRIGDFHILLGADGASSWVRKSYFHEFENEEGKSYALGLAFDRPMGLPWSQPLNVFLTLGQTRYLLNASDSDGRGYLNMQLTEDEWLRMVSNDGQPVHFGRPGCLRNPDGSVPEEFEESQVFAPSENRQSPLWIAISDGLKLFGFREEEVVNVVRIPMVVRTVSKGVDTVTSIRIACNQTSSRIGCSSWRRCHDCSLLARSWPKQWYQVRHRVGRRAGAWAQKWAPDWDASDSDGTIQRFPEQASPPRTREAQRPDTQSIRLARNAGVGLRPSDCCSR